MNTFKNRLPCEYIKIQDPIYAILGIIPFIFKFVQYMQTARLQKKKKFSIAITVSIECAESGSSI